jgi:hypothetical protein
MVPYNDDPFAETGIRADADAPDPESSTSGAIIVEWHPIDPATLVNVRVGGYYLYRSEKLDVHGTPVEFARIAEKSTSLSSVDSSYQDTDVRQNRVYSYYVTSYNRSDETQESKPSDTVNFNLTVRPVLTYPITDSIINPSLPRLKFQFGPSLAGGRVAIIVNEVQPDNEQVLRNNVWTAINIPSGGFTSPEVEFDDNRANLEKGKRYRWRLVKYVEHLPGNPPEGNSSRWATFTLAP